MAFDEVPTLESWNHFVLAVDQTVTEYIANRELLEQSVKSSSSKLEQAYDDLKSESNLRLAQADTHQKELEKLVHARTSELQNAQVRLNYCR